MAQTGASSPSQPQGLDKSDEATSGTTAGETGSQQSALWGENPKEAGAEYDFLRVVMVAEERDQMFKGSIQKTKWRRAYDAWHSRHGEGTRYADPNWRRKRSHLYRPRTRSAVRKKVAAFAASVFTSPDSVSVQAEALGDPVRSASAAIIQQCLNYRLDRASAKSGVSFFLVASGACLDAQITGICYTKQFWEYEEVTEKTTQIVVKQKYYSDTGEAVTDPTTGKPVEDQEEQVIEKKFVTKDRPQSLNFPPDNVIIDPTAYWINPEQRSGYLILKHAMTEDDAEQLMGQPGKNNEDWLDVPKEMLRRVMEEYTSKGVRISRASDRVDPLENRAGDGAVDKPRSNIVWLYECFIRVSGVDYHFWSLGSRAYASKIRTTRQAYPEQRGERPVTRGYAQIETHETYPESPVTSWLPMQNELNDIVNLRIDTMRQALSPIAKVKQGTTFDFAQLQNRGGENTTVIVRNMDDLAFDRTPDVTASAYQETAQINSDFDDLAAVFQPSSVDTNRRLNETVGGMQMMSGAATAVEEFDTRTFMETWGEPTLRQIVRLEQYFETDETIFALAGARARIDRFGVESVTDQDLEQEVSVRVNAGLGSADPMQRLAKLSNSIKMLGPLMPMMNKPVRVKAEETVDEIMGLAGYHDGRRFFEFEEGPPPPTPAIAKMQTEQMREQNRLQIAQTRDQTVLQREHMREMATLLEEILKQKGAAALAGMDAQNQQPTGDGSKPPSISINFKDATPEVKAQILAKAGIFIHPDTIAAYEASTRHAQPAAGVPATPSIGNATAMFTALSALLAPPEPPQMPPGPGGGAPPGGPGPGAGGPPPGGGGMPGGM